MILIFKNKFFSGRMADAPEGQIRGGSWALRGQILGSVGLADQVTWNIDIIGKGPFVQGRRT